jgi:SAM-dependent methyltransferase
METYDSIGVGYAKHRQPDGRIAGRIRTAIGDARTLVNVGAGAGSYEPDDMAVTAVEPSWRMLAQHGHKALVVRAAAEQLPFTDASCDVALAVLTVHHWQALAMGLREMVRVARQRVVILTWDPEHTGFWLTRDYFPEMLELDRALFPRLRDLDMLLGGVRAEVVPIPADCADGFLGAYWRRPSAYLDPEIRRSISTFSRIADLASDLARLRSDLEDGTWRKRNEAILARDELDLGYRLIVARGSRAMEV